MPIFIDIDPSTVPTNAIGINARVQLDVSKLAGLEATDGSVMDDDYQLIFYTEATPLYATVDYIMLMGGEVVESMPEAALYIMSFAASTFIDDMLLFNVDTKFPDKTTQAYYFFNRARTEFVRCKAIVDILRAVIASKGTLSGRRTLADFTIDLSSQANLIAQARGMISDAMAGCRYWLQALYSGGAVDFERLKPSSAVKSGANPYEQGGIGRGWMVGGPTMNAREDSYIRSDGSKNRPRRGYSARSKSSTGWW